MSILSSSLTFLTAKPEWVITESPTPASGAIAKSIFRTSPSADSTRPGRNGARPSSTETTRPGAAARLKVSKAEGAVVIDEVIGRDNGSWARINDSDGQLLVVSRRPVDPVLAEETFFVGDDRD